MKRPLRQCPCRLGDSLPTRRPARSCCPERHQLVPPRHVLPELHQAARRGAEEDAAPQAGRHVHRGAGRPAASLPQRHRLHGLVIQVVEPVYGDVPTSGRPLGLPLQRALRERHALATGVEHQSPAPPALDALGANDVDILRCVAFKWTAGRCLLEDGLRSLRLQAPPPLLPLRVASTGGRSCQPCGIHAKVVRHDEVFRLHVATQRPWFKAAAVWPTRLEGTALDELGELLVRHLPVPRADMDAALSKR
mmetsp:Transcript_106310/g.338559  ORF Transcript_106310/g.338559 Transcript_106310/m.338559 type:complete len:250 (-) Transcript_106310:90-839(-)